MEKLFFRNILFTGDAAHLSNPVGGDGIAQAMLSGRLAAEVSTDSILKGDPRILEKYESKWEKIRLGNFAVQDAQYGLYIVQKVLLSMPFETEKEVLEELWSSALKSNQYPLNLISALENKKMRSAILGIIMKDRRLRNWAIGRFFSLAVKKLGI